MNFNSIKKLIFLSLLLIIFNNEKTIDSKEEITQISLIEEENNLINNIGNVE